MSGGGLMQLTGMPIKTIKKLHLKNGFYLEVAYHHGLKMLAAEFHAPAGDKWAIVYADTPKELMGKVRLGIAMILNPKLSDFIKMTNKALKSDNILADIFSNKKEGI